MGQCPHCSSRNIRRRYREHRRYKWRCRECNRVFRAPKRGIRIWLGLVILVGAVVSGVWWFTQQRLPQTSGTLPPASVESITALTTTLQSMATSKAANAPKVQATVGANARSAINSVIATTPPRPTPTLTPEAASNPVNTPTAQKLVRKENNTPTAAHTPIPIPSLRHIDEKRYMLKLINAERKKAGVPPVELGDNTAAQLHAESALKNCFSSHWGIDGLKPYMRYSLAGGYQSNGENGHGIDYCIKSGDGYVAIASVEDEITDAMNGWMSSHGHRRSILDKNYMKVNIGLAWDEYNFFAYQHFEGDYVKYANLPSIENGRLSFEGNAKSSVSFNTKRDLGVQIYYDPPPHELTRGQVSRTYCYGSGRQIAALREPLTGNQHWTTDEFFKPYNPCPDPYDVSPDASAPRSHNQAHTYWEQAYQASKKREEQTITVPWITATEWELIVDWDVSDISFAVEADISEVLNKYGNGVYTVTVWGKIDGEDAVISEYSIFYGITPPNTYTPH